ncbi:arginyl-tRNA--protein transferase 1 isoform X2 [Hyalella azteca]|uniref:Arginyl-tRNA--protein transferase 1 n=1 Tax=Hyalella azteca TaxID=294128 RepID=A0A8B7NI57_HYAAZ|nr:arginyl-tRNA--protein transferase 1 isoform X2 [Hyalella azteca]
MDNQYSIVEYTRDHSGYRCGYCKSSNANYSHGMHAYCLTVDHYQGLIDRGWRRSGSYCYKPTMHRTCCPAYTIRCHAPSFHLSKSQKKVLKRMNNFLAHGTRKQSSESSTQQHCDGGSESFPEVAVQHLERLGSDGEEKKPQITTLLDEVPLQEERQKASSRPPHEDQVVGSPSSLASSESSLNASKKMKTVSPGLGADPNKPACRKARVKRLERRQAKLQRLQENDASSSTASFPSSGPSSAIDARKKDKNAPKSLEDLLNESITDSPAHTLELRLVRVDEADVESLVAPHALFKRYQKAVHHETDDECNFNVYFHFLVDTPIKEQHPDAGPSSGLGSFHQQYWLDGEKLIAVAVIDILPCCVSSVYFYYDPEYSFLSLGTYSSLRELALTRELGREYSRLAWYYMGFYIHSCPKMRYKGHYEPSFLLCPETYSWCPLPPSVKKLDVNKYSRLVENSSEEDTEGTNIDIDKILVLHQRRPMRYGTFRELKGADEALDVVVREYAGLVGKTAACTMMLSLP